MGLMAQYTLNEHFRDNGKNGFDGVAVGNIVFIDGKINRATSFLNGRIDLPIVGMPNNFSFSAWFYKVTSDWSSSSIIGNRNGTMGYMLYRNAGDSIGYLRWYTHYTDIGGITREYLKSGAWLGYWGLPVGQWVHLVVTMDSEGETYLYRDGNVVDKHKPTDFGAWRQSALPMGIATGAGGSTSWQTTGSAYEDIRLFNHVLTHDEVVSLYWTRDKVKGRLRRKTFHSPAKWDREKPLISDGLIRNYPLVDGFSNYVPQRIRYIRDYLGHGSTANSSSHWEEIQAINKAGVNVALNKKAYFEDDESRLCPQLVDGIINSAQWSLPNMSGGTFRTIDLLGWFNLSSIRVWHFYADGRRYFKTKTAVSENGRDWFFVFDSQYEGEYNETAAGRTTNLISNNPITATNPMVTENGVGIHNSYTNLIAISNMESYAVGHTGDVCGFTNNWLARFGAGNFNVRIIEADNSPVPNLTKCQRIETFGDGWGGWVSGTNLGGIADEPVVFSLWVRVWHGMIDYGNLNTSERIRATTDTSWREQATYRVVSPGEWVYVGNTVLARSGGRHLYALNTTKADVLAVMVDNSQVLRPYVNGVSGITKLTYATGGTMYQDDFTVVMDTFVPDLTLWRMPSGLWSKWYFAWSSGSSNRLVVSWVDGTQMSIGATVPGLDCRQWNNIGFSYRKFDGRLRIYANGEMVAETIGVNLPVVDSGACSIGDLSSSSHAHKLLGQVKNYLVYDRELTELEMWQIAKKQFRMDRSGDLICDKAIVRENSSFCLGNNILQINGIKEYT